VYVLADTGARLQRRKDAIAAGEVAVDQLYGHAVARERSSKFTRVCAGVIALASLREIDAFGIGIRGTPAILALDDRAP
jgi:hypothetical protein